MRKTEIRRKRSLNNYKEQKSQDSWSQDWQLQFVWDKLMLDEAGQVVSWQPEASLEKVSTKLCENCHNNNSAMKTKWVFKTKSLHWKFGWISAKPSPKGGLDILKTEWRSLWTRSSPNIVKITAKFSWHLHLSLCNVMANPWTGVFRFEATLPPLIWPEIKCQVFQHER